MTEFRLDGRTTVVTGGASGIGRAIALCFAANGSTIRIVDQNKEAAEATAAQIVSSGGAATAHACDITDRAQVDRAFAEILKLTPINVLINSAGVAHIGDLESTSEEDFERLFRINVLGTHHAMRAAIAPMVEHGGGVILNMASIAANAGLADRYAYSMSKGAVLSMTYSVARDYIDKKIRCNAISPARVHTPFIDGYIQKNYPGQEKEILARLSASQPIGRMAEPREVALLALYLCSDAASFLTGSDYPLDGGFYHLRG